MVVTPALTGLKVLELGDRGSAAFAGRLFADCGASVTRVSSGVEPDGLDSPWPYLLRGKAIIDLDWRNPDCGNALAELTGASDLLIADMLPAEAAAVGWSSLGENSRLRVRSIVTPLGLTGEACEAPTATSTLLARSGHTFLMGDPQRAPLSLPDSYVAYQSGLFAYSATLAAWLGPSDTGSARTVELSELEVLASLHQHTTVRHSYAGRIRRRRGNQYDGTYPITMLPCRDGWCGICIVASFWERFARWLEPRWLTDPRFADSPTRWAHRDDLDLEITRVFARRTRQELEHEGQHVQRLPVGAVDTPNELLEDPHLTARGFWSEDRVGDRAVRFPGLPFRFLHDSEIREPPARPEARLTSKPAADQRGDR
jgi:benzylsuccinate CoA-transferase BbsF subunit